MNFHVLAALFHYPVVATVPYNDPPDELQFPTAFDKIIQARISRGDSIRQQLCAGEFQQICDFLQEIWGPMADFSSDSA